MPDVSFSGLVIVAAVAFLSPLLLGLAPKLRLPSVVVEIVVGIVIGPSVLGWVEPDLVIRITAVLGLAFLLFLAGLEIELERFRGRFLRISLLGLALSFAISLVVAFGLSALGLLETPLIVAIILLATSLRPVAPVLKDVNETGSGFGQLVIASASIADFAAVILLSLFFSREATGAGVKLLLLGLFIALLAVAGFVVARAGSHGASRTSCCGCKTRLPRSACVGRYCSCSESWRSRKRSASRWCSEPSWRERSSPPWTETR